MRRCLTVSIAIALLVGLSPSCGFLSLPHLIDRYVHNDRDPSDGVLEFVAECMTGTDLDHDGRAPHDPATDHHCCCQGTVLFKENPDAVRITVPCTEVQHLALFVGGPQGGFATRVWQPPQA